MHELSDKELYQAIEYAKSIDEETGRSILNQFQKDQPALAQTLFNIFPSVIAERSQDLAYLFMDMCFDIICIYQHAFGSTPIQNEVNQDWLEKQAALMDAEIQALIPENNVDTKIKEKLQNRLIERVQAETVQQGLINFMNAWIDEFNAETPNSEESVKTTKGMIFAAVRLFNNLYVNNK